LAIGYSSLQIKTLHGNVLLADVCEKQKSASDSNKDAKSMRIAALSLHATSGWPEMGTDALTPGLHVFHGPSASGKSTVADLVTHAIYGRRFVAEAAQSAAPEGEVIVEHRDRRYRLRRSHDETAGERLTVSALDQSALDQSALDQSAVDQDTVRQLVACLSPALLRPLFAMSFREPARLDWVLSADFAHEFRAALWQLKWAPPTVESQLRPLYARLRALETQVGELVRRMDSPRENEAKAKRARTRTRARRASHFLALLTDGELVRLRLGRNGKACVITRDGNALAVESLWSTQKDLVYMSLCFALISSLRRHGVRLPVVLDEPFARLDARTAAALVDVLDRLAARGHQVLVFTGRQEVARRFGEIGATVHEMAALQGVRVAASAKPQTVVEPVHEEHDAPVRRMRRRVKTTRVEHREAG
jgi:hypothetical protein